MEIRAIKAFLVLSECLNFTKSAEQVYLTQPALSRQINNLEYELGCELFTRSKRKVELTEYGRAFMEHAVHICTELEKWQLELKQMKSGNAGRLRIGFLQDFPYDFFPLLINSFVAKNPNVEMSFFDSDINATVDGVVRGDLDCGFSLHNEISKFDQIDSLAVSPIKECAALPADHPLANRESIKMEELADSKFIMAEDLSQGSLHTRFLCRTAGFEPTVVAYTKFVPSMFTLVKCGVGIGIVAQAARDISPGGINFVSIDNEYASMEVLLFWKKTTTNPLVPLFIKTAKGLLT
jgi:DNA-binding transcriptional LysR family regulator